MITGWVHYKLYQPKFIKSSNEVYFKKECLDGYISLLHHGWLSQEGMSEAYNESHRDSPNVIFFKQFLEENPTIGNHFKGKKNNENCIDDEVNIPESEETTSTEAHVANMMYEMHRKNILQALYGQWIMEELKDRNKIGKVLFGPKYDDAGQLVTYQESVDAFLDCVDAWRTNELYQHEECTGRLILGSSR